MDRVFTTPEIARLVGKTIHKTIAYTKRDLIKPSVEEASGHGSRRVWSYVDVVRMCMIVELESLGLGVAMIRRYSKLIPNAWLLDASSIVGWQEPVREAGEISEAEFIRAMAIPFGIRKDEDLRVAQGDILVYDKRATILIHPSALRIMVDEVE
jgi:DNA-binding transcriptional MerR regulator